MPSKDNNIKRRKIFDSQDIDSMISRISGLILREFASDISNIAMIGIQLKGVPLANRIAGRIAEKKGISVPVGTIDISMYRDDIGYSRPISRTYETYIPFDVDERVIILVDDILQSGRTIRAALDAITDYGRPSLIRLAVLIDRLANEYPISADYAGLRKKFPANKRISVAWEELGENDAIYLKDARK